ncbi:(Dimethylallyl)adenosine tRNA methylthiotransferase MiaB [Desulfamplus magnetovallimortis]|uniref:tRNA-2-methylthio-N(6)-dimethylallyladenosine synthase n=1 Tax=Desulfamplus magnetovallimortis TaxID=1246637 RepID=A0A1W1HKG6_9BACT|nr:tRNA (N6-isopentenyl adenosine(37)-C2)-methylthiotransferase MiaB [Desulfamplus magnetovallimortis]SLM33007.1 (Dimethylallyl)adenosine tRNA methylthiotransferase MiaB [Desulfamplus magnetovallimortis]
MKLKGYAYIYTIGCQMNTYDSEKLAATLASIGYGKTEDLDKADVVVCNTCSIREKAQEKAYSFLGTLAAKKRKNPNIVAVMSGCVAQQEGEKVFKRIPHLDIVMGTQAFERLPELISMVHTKRMRSEKSRVTDTGESIKIFESMPDFSTLDNEKVSRFVTIMQGCDNFCTYCVVPYVRGRERSRNPESIVKEIAILADAGVREITLLGQNVNSYGKKEGICSFPELLEKINSIAGLERIRFATSHPKDLSDDLIFAIRDLDKVCNQLHLPVQSGSNAILKKMNRNYTRESYLERIDTLRKHCPGIGISSDMIVGFPSETREDFDLTLDLVKTVEFDGLFAFAYSDRPNAPAAHFPGALDEKEKMARLNELLELQEYYTQKANQALKGSVETVLVEGQSLKKRHTYPEGDEFKNSEVNRDLTLKGSDVHRDLPLKGCDVHSDLTRNSCNVHRDLPQMTGRTDSGKIVHFQAKDIEPGQMVQIRIEHAYPHSLWGTVCTETGGAKKL